MKQHFSRAACLGLAVIGIAAVAEPAAAQWSTVYEQTYLPAPHNWEFRERYRAADRLFNAFDYGHAILYETLYRKPDAPASELEERIYDRLTRRVLVNPPHVPLEEAAIEVAYAKLAPEAKAMFDWAHILHRQVYDIWAAEDLAPAERDRAVAEVLAYYRSRPDLAFSARPKTMELMEGQYYSTAFRDRYPKFNGLIWAYHWLQVGLYEPLIVGRDEAEKQTGVTAAVARFWQMLEDPPNNMPRIMPMTAAVAPMFAERYPEVAVVFDNLHSMHDVVSDILASPEVPRRQKRAAILEAARRYRDDTSFAMTMDEWRSMALAMGIENQGGPAMGYMQPLPEGSVRRGAVMAGMDHAGHERPAEPGAHAEHDPGPEPDAHAEHDAHAAHDAPGDMHEVEPEGMRLMHELHMRMMQDSVIHERVRADTAMHRMMMEMMRHMPAEHREEMMRRMRPEPGGHEGHRHGGADRQDPHAGHGRGEAVGEADEASARAAAALILRLLADPAVDSRVHADPELHRLWSAARAYLDAAQAPQGASQPPGN